MADIDLSRPIIRNPDGTFSTESTITVEADGRHYVLPTIVGGKRLSSDDATKAWSEGRNPHVGVFATNDEAEKWATERSNRIGKLRGKEMAENDPLGGLPPPAQAQALFSNPEFLQGAALIAAKNRDPNAMKWLEQAHLAAREGAFEAVGHLMAGNPQEAVNVWNRTGQFRDVENVNKNQDGTYTITRRGGITMTLDPVKEYRRMLSPREFVAAQQHEAEMKDRQERYRLEDQRYNERMQAEKDWRDAQQQRWKVQDAQHEGDQALAHARWLAGAGGGGTRGTGSRTGGAGAGAAGDTGFNKDAVKSYADWRKELVDINKAQREASQEAPLLTEEAISEHAFIQQMRSTAELHDDKTTGDTVIRARMPSGAMGTIARFSDRGVAAEAIQNLVRYGELPKSLYVPRTGTPMEIQAWQGKGSPSTNLRAVENNMPAVSSQEALTIAKQKAAPAQQAAPVAGAAPSPRQLPPPATAVSIPKTYVERQQRNERLRSEDLASKAAQGEIDREEFSKDVATMRPADLALKWDTRREHLSREQRIKLNQVMGRN
jgi:hypothetical protein